MMKPSIGRKVYLFLQQPDFTDRPDGGVLCLDKKQPFDATIVFVHDDGKINVRASDHYGRHFGIHGIELREPQAGDEHGQENIVTWMPFQVGQARAQADAAGPKAGTSAAADQASSTIAPSTKAIPMVPVTSSNISAVGFDSKTSTLAVQFSSGTIYHYGGVSEQLATQLVQSESVGAFFAKSIRSKFPATQVGGKASAETQAQPA